MKRLLRVEVKVNVRIGGFISFAYFPTFSLLSKPEEHFLFCSDIEVEEITGYLFLIKIQWNSIIILLNWLVEWIKLLLKIGNKSSIKNGWLDRVHLDLIQAIQLHSLLLHGNFIFINSLSFGVGDRPIDWSININSFELSIKTLWNLLEELLVLNDYFLHSIYIVLVGLVH